MNSMGENPIVEYNQIKWYPSVVGKFAYAMVVTRPDIAFVVSSLGQHNAIIHTGHIVHTPTDIQDSTLH